MAVYPALFTDGRKDIIRDGRIRSPPRSFLLIAPSSRSLTLLFWQLLWFWEIFCNFYSFFFILQEFACILSSFLLMIAEKANCFPFISWLKPKKKRKKEKKKSRGKKGDRKRNENNEKKKSTEGLPTRYIGGTPTDNRRSSDGQTIR